MQLRRPVLILLVGMAIPVQLVYSQAPSRTFSEMSFGFSSSMSAGPLSDTNGLAWALSFGFPVSPEFTIGLAFTVIGDPTSGLDDCRIVTPGGPCIDPIPIFPGIAVELGWHHRISEEWWELGVRTGVGAHYDGGERSWGPHLQVDISHDVSRRTALLLGVRGTMLPSFRDQTVFMGAAVLGIRIQARRE